MSINLRLPGPVNPKTDAKNAIYEEAKGAFSSRPAKDAHHAGNAWRRQSHHSPMAMRTERGTLPPRVDLFIDQRTGAVGDVRSAHSILDDTSEQPPDCFRIGRMGLQQPQSGFGVHDDSADRLVDFGNRRR